MSNRRLELPRLEAVFYHHDYDGAVSAAMLVRAADHHMDLFDVDYEVAPQWAAKQLPQAAAVVDFLFHPDATLWVDHHSTAFQKESWKALLQSSPCYVWEPDAPACPIVLATHFAFDNAHVQHFAPYVHWATKIDSALYASPDEAIDLSNPHILISRVIALLTATPSIATLVRLIAWNSPDQVLADSSIRPIADMAQEQDQSLRRQALGRMQFDGTVVMLDQIDGPAPYQRYLPYSVHPDAVYVVGAYRNGGSKIVVSVGENPWKEHGSVDVGSFCAQFGGGGHRSVGGVVAESPSHARELMALIASKLSRAAAQRDRAAR